MLKVATKRGTQTGNSYVDVDFADNYFTTVLDTLWDALLSNEKEAALITASQYIDGHYYFIGKVKSSSQLLAWPRIAATDSDGRKHDGIPERLKQACSELALESAINGLDNPLQDENFINNQSQKVGEIETKVQYMDSKPVIRIYPKVDALLRPLIANHPSAYFLQLER